MNKHLILVQQDDSLAKFYKRLLLEKGFKVTLFKSGLKFLEDIHNLDADLIICAYELSDIDGETLYAEVYTLYPDIPIIIISAIKDESLITRMLQHDNCEFMLHPIVPAELMSRINKFLLPQETATKDNGDLVVADLVLNDNTKRAHRGDREIILTPTEYRLLQYLMENANRVLTRDMILNRVWATTEDVSDRIVDVYIGYLREKIDKNSEIPLIHTTPGFGYSIHE
ncbi:MAG: winged helix-turn-helix transcriptional regulator [Patescibacteria group bacterium]